jgi:hypothetical protein
MHIYYTDWFIQDYCKIPYSIISIVLNNIVKAEHIPSLDIARACHIKTRSTSSFYNWNVQMV